MEVDDLRRVHAEHADRYAEARAAAETRVVEERYAAGWRVDDLEPYGFERSGMRRPRLTRKVKEHGVVHGYDAGGTVVLIRDTELWTLGWEWYRIDGERSVAYETWHPPDSGWRLLAVRAHLQEREGDVLVASGALVVEDGGPEAWWIERYRYDDAGRLAEVVRSRSPSTSPEAVDGDEVHRLEYDAKGRLRVVRGRMGDGPELVVYLELDGALQPQLDQLAADTAQALAAALDEHDDVHALVLVYSEGQYDITCSPMLLHEDDWQELAGEGLDVALNPGEWEHEDELALPPELEERRRLLQVAVTSKGTGGRAWVRELARRVNALRPDGPPTRAIDPAMGRVD